MIRSGRQLDPASVGRILHVTIGSCWLEAQLYQLWNKFASSSQQYCLPADILQCLGLRRVPDIVMAVLGRYRVFCKKPYSTSDLGSINTRRSKDEELWRPDGQAVNGHVIS
jgi:hypothetical protein